MVKTITCCLQTTSAKYEIEICGGLLNDHKKLAHTLAPFGTRLAIITDDNVACLYGNELLHCLLNNGFEAHLFSFPEGERHKSRATKELLENRLFEAGLGRDTCVIALGGGVATDLGGYLSATYCRGVPLIMIPTTLLGMVDASIGGKTGVNTPFGKNMVGCIYQPKKVLIDCATLKSLPPQEFRNGIAEMIKHGLIADRSFFEYLEEHSEDLLVLDASALEKAIFESCRIKKEIVEEDERESGKRRLLNFGHTIGHALEHLSHYSMAHGEAVAAGILIESQLSLQMGYLKQSSFDRIQQILNKYAFKLTSQLSTESILAAMTLDKKSLKGKPRFVVIDEIGSALSFQGDYCMQIDENLLKNVLQWFIPDSKMINFN